MRLRELEPGEEPRLLDLLDGWPFRDGRRGREFFRRYLEDDPSYEARNVLIAECDGALVSCVQIFPRTVRTAVGPKPCGGIGSVFTAPEHRRSGVASRLLRLAVDAMDSRGLALSLLWASRLSWYSSLGWYELDGSEVLLEPPGRPPDVRPGRLLASDGDLERVASVAEDYGASRWGTVVRGREAWRSGLRSGGDPGDELWISGRGGEIDGFLRLGQLASAWRALEWGCVPGGRARLAELLLAHARNGVILPPIRDLELEGELVARGARLTVRASGTSWMLRPVTMTEAEARTALPAERFAFWPADRF